jgi:hypothetical protein
MSDAMLYVTEYKCSNGATRRPLLQRVPDITPTLRGESLLYDGAAERFFLGDSLCRVGPFCSEDHDDVVAAMLMVSVQKWLIDRLGHIHVDHRSMTSESYIPGWLVNDHRWQPSFHAALVAAAHAVADAEGIAS